MQIGWCIPCLVYFWSYNLYMYTTYIVILYQTSIRHQKLSKSWNCLPALTEWRTWIRKQYLLSFVCETSLTWFTTFILFMYSRVSHSITGCNALKEFLLRCLGKLTWLITLCPFGRESSRLRWPWISQELTSFAFYCLWYLIQKLNLVHVELMKRFIAANCKLRWNMAASLRFYLIINSTTSFHFVMHWHTACTLSLNLPFPMCVMWPLRLFQRTF